MKKIATLATLALLAIGLVTFGPATASAEVVQCPHGSPANMRCEIRRTAPRPPRFGMPLRPRVVAERRGEERILDDAPGGEVVRREERGRSRIRGGGCPDGFLELKENDRIVGCNKHVTDEAALERHRVPLSSVCGTGSQVVHGRVDRRLADGGIAHYDCP